MKLDLQNKVVLVTGGGRGIGRAIGLMLGRAGARVFLAARTESELETAAAEISREGGTAETMCGDISVEQDIVALFSGIKDAAGRLDVLVNNAGLGIYGPVAEFSAEDLDRVLTVNLRGTFLCCREAMKLMIPAGKGYVINISSVVGFRGYPDQAAYAAAKHGVMGLTKSLATEVQEHGIRVSAVLPGGVDTPMVREARPELQRDELLHPADVAGAVEYLLSLSDRAAVDQIYIRRANSKPF